MSAAESICELLSLSIHDHELLFDDKLGEGNLVILPLSFWMVYRGHVIVDVVFCPVQFQQCIFGFVFRQKHLGRQADSPPPRPGRGAQASASDFRPSQKENCKQIRKEGLI